MVSFWLLVLFGFIFVGVVLMVFVLSLSLSLWVVVVFETCCIAGSGILLVLVIL